MIDAKKILADLLQPNNSASSENENKTTSTLSGANFSINDILGGLFGGNEKGNMLEGFIKGGGLAAVASVAFNALKSFQNHEASADSKLDLTEIGQTGSEHNGDFALTLVRSMIAAAKADGRIDDKERTLIQNKIADCRLDKKTTAFLTDELNKPVDINNLVSNVNSDEQKAELYVASRMTLDPQNPQNRQYLDNLRQKLGLPESFNQHIEQAIITFLR
ncbi:tellurite resistance TerB family protein [uncultured Bartonella sp.]|uniref:tellurite resistance TerB family protein n=1 Tax=uncultured Bartonella sp. TaxID=104108 RepID=UPI0026059774|nr:tellurite resistance TerB family protein [uncultured Bartonella sp.]